MVASGSHQPATFTKEVRKIPDSLLRELSVAHGMAARSQKSLRTASRRVLMRHERPSSATRHRLGSTPHLEAFKDRTIAMFGISPSKGCSSLRTSECKDNGF
jgi:hypothetical protein